MKNHLDDHKSRALDENIAFLRDCGLIDEMIALRLGVTVDAIQKRKERKNERLGNTDPGPDLGEERLSSPGE